jgi:DNA-binding NarL/FixJ family response regulator
MNAILLTSDLTVVSHVDGAAARTGSTVRTVSNPADVVQRCESETVELVVIDLGTPSLEMASLVASIKATTSAPRVIAFGPHVHTERLTAARDAGCDAVMSRGQFFANTYAALR